jgi:tetratricopeptide (TPR) repeat protein
MEENNDYFIDEENTIIDRYIEMINSKSAYYFDIFELEIIIDNYLDQHELKLAGGAIGYALKIHPHSLIILQKKAQALIMEGYPFKSLKILKNLIKVEPSNSKVAFLLGVVYCSLGEISKALYQFDNAIAIGSDDNEELLLNTATTLEQIGQYEFAVKYFNLAYLENNENSIVIYELAYCYEKINKDLESIEYYKKYLFIDPYSRLAWTNLAGVYYKLERYDESIDAIEFAIAIDPHYSFSYFQKGVSEIFNNMNERGIESLSQFLKDEPEDPEAHYYLGEAYVKLGRNKDAIESFEKAIIFDNNHSDAYYGQAYILFMEKKYPDAYYAIKKAIKIDPLESDFWHLSALISKSLGFIEDSEMAFKTGIELDHTDPQIWIDYSELENGKKGLFKKINILSQAFEHFSQSAEINFRLAANLALIQNVDSAVFHLNEALKAEPSKIDIFRSIYSDNNIVLETIIDKYRLNNFDLEYFD